jgi:hypothetical protein
LSTGGIGTRLARASIEQLAQQVGRAFAAAGLDQRIEGVEPFAGFDGIGIGGHHAPEGGGKFGKVGHCRLLRAHARATFGCYAQGCGMGFCICLFLNIN